MFDALKKLQHLSWGQAALQSLTHLVQVSLWHVCDHAIDLTSAISADLLLQVAHLACLLPAGLKKHTQQNELCAHG